MGKCGSQACYPAPGPSLRDLQDTPVGGQYNYNKGCCPSIGGKQGGSGYAWCSSRGFKYPNNGEFDFALGSGCSMCSDVGGGYGCECGGPCGGEAIGGSRPAVVRTAYLADKTQCCLQGTAIIGDKTCDPAYRGMGTPACKEVLRQYCDNAGNFFNPTCKEWVGNLNEQATNQLAQKYCANSQDEWCACFTATVPPEWKGTTKEALFRCLDPKCQGGNNPNALRPYALTCPTSFVECQQNDIRLALEKSGIDKATIENKCGAIELAPPPPAPATPAPTSGGGGAPTGGTPTTGGTKLSKPMIYGIAGGSVALILIIIIIVVAVMLGKKKKAGAAAK